MGLLSLLIEGFLLHKPPCKSSPPLPLGQQLQQWGVLEAGAGIHGLSKGLLSPSLQ